jgi:hypothetical protein
MTANLILVEKCEKGALGFVDVIMSFFLEALLRMFGVSLRCPEKEKNSLYMVTYKMIDWIFGEEHGGCADRVKNLWKNGGNYRIVVRNPDLIILLDLEKFGNDQCQNLPKQKPKFTELHTLVTKSA